MVFLCIAVTFKLLVKGQTPLVRHWHSNWPFLSGDWIFSGGLCMWPSKKVLLLITNRINNEVIWNLNALRSASTCNTIQYFFTSLTSSLCENRIRCTWWSNLSTWDETLDAASQWLFKKQAEFEAHKTMKNPSSPNRRLFFKPKCDCAIFLPVCSTVTHLNYCKTRAHAPGSPMFGAD